MDERFQPYLLPGERVLWRGQPNATRLLTAADVFLIPFSLLWGGFALTFVFTAFVGNPRGAPAMGPFLLFPLVFGATGLYFIVGRFFYKYLDRRRTYYALTDQRALVLKELFGSKLQAAFLRNVPGVGIAGRGDVGTVSFDGADPSFWSFEDTGWGWTGWGRGGSSWPRFRDVRDARRVYQLANAQLAADSGPRTAAAGSR